MLPRWRLLRWLLLLRLGDFGSRTTRVSSSTTVLLLSSSSTITASSHEQESSTHSARRTDVQRSEYASGEFRFIWTSCRIPAASSECGLIPSCSTRFLWPSCRSLCDLFGYIGFSTSYHRIWCEYVPTTHRPRDYYSPSLGVLLDVHP